MKEIQAMNITPEFILTLARYIVYAIAVSTGGAVILGSVAAWKVGVLSAVAFV